MKRSSSLALIAALTGCGPETPPSDSATVTLTASVGPETSASAAAPTKGTNMKGYPWARLPRVEPIDVALSPEELAGLGAKSFKAFETDDGVRIWLLVFEFDDQAKLLAGKEKVASFFGGSDSRAPYYVETAYTGSWLLVAGFPGSKPVSPEMDKAKQDALQRWWGEE